MNLFLFAMATAVLAWISRRNLLQPHSHGFYRFFAWECILLLFLHIRPFWFVDRFAAHQWLSWLLLFTSIALLMGGTTALRRHGQSNPARNNDSLFAFEKTTQLIQHGIYAGIRHPLYASLLCLAWGLFFKQPWSWHGIGLAGMATASLVFSALTEETENLAYFGPSYATYMTRTKRFVPGVW